jgi:4-amino-4-deoxy-L-arabinose transferase-like glycosyltransferase
MTQKHRLWLVLLALVMLAFALRLYRLDFQPLRGDEGFDVMFASRPLSALVNELRVTQPYPPLYHVLLHGWLELAGKSEFALRFISMSWGVLLVVLTYRLGRDLFSVETGLLAALLTAAHPFYLWHAQDGRMYTMLTGLSLASTLLALQILLRRNGRGWRIWSSYAISTVLALLTHYFAFLVLAAQNVIALIEVVRHRDTALLRRWVGSQLVMALLYLPWAVFAWPLLTTHTSGWIQPAGLLEILKRCFISFSVGFTVEPSHVFVPLAAFLCVFGSGVFLWKWQQRRDSTSLVALAVLLVVPLIAVYLASLRRPMFDERYLIIIVPFYLLFLGRGLAQLGRWRTWTLVLAGVLLAWGMGRAMWNYYFDPSYAKSPPWPALTAYLEAQTGPDDVIVQNYPDPTFDYYYHGQSAHLVVPGGYLEDERRAETIADLTALRDEYERLWFMPMIDPGWDYDGFVGRWLDRHCDKVSDRRVASFRLVLYLTPRAFLPTMQPLNVVLGDDIHLLGYRLEGDDGDLIFDPGETVHLTLYWQTSASLHTDYTVFTHLLDVTGWLRGQQDNPPVYGTYPTMQWAVDEIIVDKYGIVLEAGAPPGTYALELGMYDPATVERLPVRDEEGTVLGDRMLLSGAIEVK